MISLRQCEDCKYTTIILNDNLNERKCKHCGGLLRIIKREIEEIKK